LIIDRVDVQSITRYDIGGERIAWYMQLKISNDDSNKLGKLTGRVIRDIRMSMACLDLEWIEYLAREVSAYRGKHDSV
jgi:hypothetical protein